MGSKLANIAKAPVKFFSSASFLWIWAVYALTYATANVVESIALALGASPATPVLISSTFANMGICLAKDAAFAKMFGSKDKPGQKTAGLSPTVLTLWFGRDVITQFFVFTLPILLTGVVPDLVCRLSAPVGAQYFTTPLHVLGLTAAQAAIAAVTAWRAGERSWRPALFAALTVLGLAIVLFGQPVEG